MSEEAGMILAARSEAKSCVCASPRFGEGISADHSRLLHFTIHTSSHAHCHTSTICCHA